MKLIVKNIPAATYKKWLVLCIGMLKNSRAARRLLSFADGFATAIIDGPKNMIALLGVRRKALFTYNPLTGGVSRAAVIGETPDAKKIRTAYVLDESAMHRSWLRQPSHMSTVLLDRPERPNTNTNKTCYILRMIDGTPTLQSYEFKNAPMRPAAAEPEEVLVRTKNEGVFRIAYPTKGRVTATVWSMWNVPPNIPGNEEPSSGSYPSQTVMGIVETKVVNGENAVHRAYVRYVTTGETYEIFDYEIDSSGWNSRYYVMLHHPDLMSAYQENSGQYYVGPVYVGVERNPAPNTYTDIPRVFVGKDTATGDFTVAIKTTRVGQDIDDYVFFSSGNIFHSIRRELNYTDTTKNNVMVVADVVRGGDITIAAELSPDRQTVTVTLNGLPDAFDSVKSFTAPIEAKVVGGVLEYHAVTAYQTVFHLSAGRVAAVDGDGDVVMDEIYASRIYCRTDVAEQRGVPLTRCWVSVEATETVMYDRTYELSDTDLVGGYETGDGSFVTYKLQRFDRIVAGNIDAAVVGPGLHGAVSYRYAHKLFTEYQNNPVRSSLTNTQLPDPQFTSNVYRTKISTVIGDDGIIDSRIDVVPVDVTILRETYRRDHSTDVIDQQQYELVRTDTSPVQIVADCLATLDEVVVAEGTIGYYEVPEISEGVWGRRIGVRYADMPLYPMSVLVAELGVFVGVVDAPTQFTRPFSKQSGTSSVRKPRTYDEWAKWPGIKINYADDYPLDAPSVVSPNVIDSYGVAPAVIQLPSTPHTRLNLGGRAVAVIDARVGGLPEIDCYMMRDEADNDAAMFIRSTVNAVFGIRRFAEAHEGSYFMVALDMAVGYTLPTTVHAAALRVMLLDMQSKYLGPVNEDPTGNNIDWEVVIDEVGELEAEAERVFDSVVVRAEFSNADMKFQSMAYDGAAGPRTMAAYYGDGVLPPE